jgi:hypothetical protein
VFWWCGGSLLSDTTVISHGPSSVIPLMEFAFFKALSFFGQLRPVSPHPKAHLLRCICASSALSVNEHSPSWRIVRPADGDKNTDKTVLSSTGKTV